MSARRASRVLVLLSSSVASAQSAPELHSEHVDAQVGAIVQFDGRWFADEDADTHVDQFQLASARIVMEATVYDDWDIQVVPDVAGGKLVIQDAYIEGHVARAFNVRFGKFKVPFGLERLQDETDTTFTARGLPTLLAPNRDLGVRVSGEVAGGVLVYQAGVFDGVADGASGDGDVSDDKDVAARVFVTPVPAHEIGFGAAVTYGEQHGHATSSIELGSFATPGQTTFFAYSPGTVADGTHWRATGQGYGYHGPVGLLTEYVRTAQDVRRGGERETATLEAWQVVAQVVLTGEDATYKSVTPSRSIGAIDVAARIGELRIVDAGTLNDGFADPAKSARRAWEATVGVDWFANRAIRFVLDLDHVWYTRGATTGGRAAETVITARAQAAF